MSGSTKGQVRKWHNRYSMAHMLQVLKHLYRQLVQQGLRCICILTKVDLIDEAVEEDVAAVQQSFAVHQLRQCISHATGIPMNQVGLRGRLAHAPPSLCRLLPAGSQITMARVGS